MTAETADAAAVRATRRFLLVAGLIPVVIALVAVTVQLTLMPRLPEVIAVSWDADGRADVFAAPWVMPVLTAGCALLVIAAVVAVGLPGLRRGGSGASYRFLGSLSAALTTFVGHLLTGMVAMQAGIDDATTAPGPGIPLLTAFLGAAVVGVGTWFAQPARPRGGRAGPGRLRGSVHHRGESDDLPRGRALRAPGGMCSATHR